MSSAYNLKQKMLNIADMRGLIKAIIDEQKEKDVNEPKITTLE